MKYRAFYTTVQRFWVDKIWKILFIVKKIVCKCIYSCDDKAEFSASSLQSSESHDPLITAQETFIISSIIDVFCNVKKAYVTFDNFNASLLNKSINSI